MQKYRDVDQKALVLDMLGNQPDSLFSNLLHYFPHCDYASMTFLFILQNLHTIALIVIVVNLPVHPYVDRCCVENKMLKWNGRVMLDDDPL